MVTLFIAVLLAQVQPCSPGETSLVCFCKQGTVSACQQLREVDPRLVDSIEKLRDGVQGALALEGQRDASGSQAATDAQSQATGAVDAELIEWLRREREATPEQFERYLRSIYNRPEMQARFPNAF